MGEILCLMMCGAFIFYIKMSISRSSLAIGVLHLCTVIKNGFGALTALKSTYPEKKEFLMGLIPCKGIWQTETH